MNNHFSKFILTSKSANSRGLDFDLTVRDVNNLCEQKYCAYSGEKFSKSKGPDSLTFERINNDKGYVRGNVVAVKTKYNVFRGNKSLEELKLCCRDPYLYYEKGLNSIIDTLVEDKLIEGHKDRVKKCNKILNKLRHEIGFIQKNIIMITESIDRIENASYFDKLKLKYGIPIDSTKKELLKEIYERVRDSL